MSRNLRDRLQDYENERKNTIHNIQKLESQIYEFEGSYLKETGAYGNAVKVCHTVCAWLTVCYFSCSEDILRD